MAVLQASSETDLNSQLINLQTDTGAIVTPGANDNDTNIGDGTFEDNSSTTPLSHY